MFLFRKIYLEKMFPRRGAFIRGGRLLSLFFSRGGVYSRGAFIRGGRLFEEIRYIGKILEIAGLATQPLTRYRP